MSRKVLRIRRSVPTGARDRETVMDRANRCLVLAVLVAGCRSYAPGWELETVSIEPVPWNSLAAFVQVEPPVDVEVTVQYGMAGRFDYETPPQILRSGTTSRIEVLGLLPDSRYQYRVQGTSLSYDVPYESKVHELASGATYDFELPTVSSGESTWPR